MPNPKNPQENPQQGGEENLPGTDFYEAEAEEEDRAAGQKIGSTFDELDRGSEPGASGRQAD